MLSLIFNQQKIWKQEKKVENYDHVMHSVFYKLSEKLYNWFYFCWQEGADCIMYQLTSGQIQKHSCHLYIPAGNLWAWETWWLCQSPGHETAPGTESSSPALYTYQYNANIGQLQQRNVWSNKWTFIIIIFNLLNIIVKKCVYRINSPAIIIIIHWEHLF